MTPADTLRAAAERLRELVFATEYRDWACEPSLTHDLYGQVVSTIDGVGSIFASGRLEDAQLAAALDPTFAGLIVILLEREANVWDEATAKLPTEQVAAVLSAPSCVTFTTLAQHILQEQS